MRITTKEATVKTASVEMKVLSISGKQMTLAVYRQLDEAAIIDEETGNLQGVPWGRVNYFWGHCKPDHLHIVWQKGEELRRSCVYKTYPTCQTEAFLDLSLMAAHYLRLWIADGCGVKRLQYSMAPILLDLGSHRIEIDVTDTMKIVLDGWQPSRPAEYYVMSATEQTDWGLWADKEIENTTQAARNLLREEVHNFIGDSVTLEQFWNYHISPRLQKLEDIKQARKVSLATLAALDLLLVAV